jgi:hypothetical protein
MKKLATLLILILPVAGFSQVESISDENDLLQRIGSYNKKEMKLYTSNEYQVPANAGAIAKTQEDSAAINATGLIYKESKVQFDTRKIAALFPEAASVDPASGAVTVDYPSFIPLLLEAINEQQKAIDTLKLKIVELEMLLKK